MNDTAETEPVDGDPLASIGQRIGARAIDWLILMAASLTIGLVSVSGDPDDELPTWAILLTLGIVFFYETLLVAFRGKTLGKSLLGIEIVTLKDGSRPSLLTAGLRVVPIIVLLVLLQQFSYVAMVFLYFTAAFLKHNRGVLDIMAGTVVIQSRRGGTISRTLGG